MFIRFKRQFGFILSITGFILLLGMAGASDVSALEGVHTPLLPLVLKGVLYLVIMAIGAKLIGGDEE